MCYKDIEHFLKNSSGKKFGWYLPNVIYIYIYMGHWEDLSLTQKEVPLLNILVLATHYHLLQN